ncbi:hypothetical protein MUG94_00685 [Arthrobacter gengyunqii]|uniref:Uncharacterized protein n=1 Tax=Arthrobacter gengyunqii TaxID=2886940 RepID=A0A9X1S5M5_9MICC|nr:hypothetical protein [Arthrobacter gengyunqii]MCC3268978.1 hypothetical protein [Arthrobacter gengyunqii]UOY96355.1 hypothetical protein MUG94_00685 [Arthrobacter gengyunqii]
MLDESREQSSTDHGLRVLVRIDTQLRLACLEVRGCLTASTYATLANILTHTGALGAAVRVNLTRAEHVESGALARLYDGADAAVRAGIGFLPADGTRPAAGRTFEKPVEIIVPPALPVCRLGPETPAPSFQPPGPALTNEEALEMAFLRRDPRALVEPANGRPQPTRPGSRTT